MMVLARARRERLIAQNHEGKREMPTTAAMSEDELESLAYTTISSGEAEEKYIEVPDLPGIIHKLKEGPLSKGYFPIRFQSIGDEIWSPDISRAVKGLLISNQVEISHNHSEVFITTGLGQLVFLKNKSLINQWFTERGVGLKEIQEAVHNLLATNENHT